MNKYMSILACTFLCGTLHATRVTLKDGNHVDVPDTVTIHNDLHESATIKELVGWIDGYFTGTQELKDSQTYTVEHAQAVTLENVRAVAQGANCILDYPKYRELLGSVSQDVYTVYKYKLSDLIAQVKENKKSAPYHIVMNMEEEFWLGFEK